MSDVPNVTPGTIDPTNTVRQECVEWVRMREYWNLVDALMMGTAEMRRQGIRYLPKRRKEKQPDYDRRLANSTVFPAYSETVATNVGRVFAKSPDIGEDVPQQIKEGFIPDVDREGRNLENFAMDWFRDAFAAGISHCLVDFTRTPGAQTNADVKAVGGRPYWVLIKHHQVIGWKADYSSGNPVLTQVRILEEAIEEAGPFQIQYVEQIRLLEPGKWTTYRKTKDKWEIVDSGETTVNGTKIMKIQLVTFYTHRIGMMEGKPPCLELAYLNAKHYRQQSDRDDLLETASVPILVTTGVTPTAQADTVDVGGKAGHDLADVNAKMFYVEHSGKAIESGRQAILDLVEEMRQAGAKLLAPIRQGKTDTEAREDIDKESSQLGRMAKALDDALDAALDLTAQWMGLGDDGGTVTTQPNLDHAIAPIPTMDILIKMANRSTLCNETLFNEAQRRGLISDEIEWEDELARIEAQGPPMPGAVTERITVAENAPIGPDGAPAALAGATGATGAAMKGNGLAKKPASVNGGQ